MPKFKTIDEYISYQPKEHAALLQDLRDAILEAVPDAKETFNYGVPAFALVIVRLVPFSGRPSSKTVPSVVLFRRDHLPGS